MAVICIYRNAYRVHILIMITLYRHALITIGFAVQRLRVKLTGGEMKFRTLL